MLNDKLCLKSLFLADIKKSNQRHQCHDEALQQNINIVFFFFVLPKEYDFKHSASLSILFSIIRFLYYYEI